MPIKNLGQALVLHIDRILATMARIAGAWGAIAPIAWMQEEVRSHHESPKISPTYRIQAQKGEKAREHYLNAFNDWIRSLRKTTSSA